MSKTIQGNLLSITHGVLAHQVNLMGVMGTLLAKQIKQRYPTVYAQYRLALGCNRLVLGDIQIVQVTPDLWVCNVAGQQYYGRNKEKCYTDYRALESALARLHQWQQCNNQPVYLPCGMGTGLAGGDWGVIEKIIEARLPDAIIVELRELAPTALDALG